MLVGQNVFIEAEDHDRGHIGLSQGFLHEDPAPALVEGDVVTENG